MHITFLRPTDVTRGQVSEVTNGTVPEWFQYIYVLSLTLVMQPC